MYSRRNTPLPPSAGTLLKRGKEEGGENVSLSPSPALFFSLMIDSVFKAGEKASGRGGGKRRPWASPNSPRSHSQMHCVTR